MSGRCLSFILKRSYFESTGQFTNHTQHKIQTVEIQNFDDIKHICPIQFPHSSNKTQKPKTENLMNSLEQAGFERAPHYNGNGWFVVAEHSSVRVGLKVATLASVR